MFVYGPEITIRYNSFPTSYLLLLTVTFKVIFSLITFIFDILIRKLAYLTLDNDTTVLQGFIILKLSFKF